MKRKKSKKCRFTNCRKRLTAIDLIQKCTGCQNAFCGNHQHAHANLCEKYLSLVKLRTRNTVAQNIGGGEFKKIDKI